VELSFAEQLALVYADAAALGAARTAAEPARYRAHGGDVCEVQAAVLHLAAHHRAAPLPACPVVFVCGFDLARARAWAAVQTALLAAGSEDLVRWAFPAMERLFARAHRPEDVSSTAPAGART
jgi:hypothetical protein